MIDLGNEEAQKETRSYGPVPAGSIVVVQMKVLDPAEGRSAPENRYVSIATSGLRQLYCQFEVVAGKYKGVEFRQSITLPFKEQHVDLNDRQVTACKIGGATFKAILQAANRPLQIKNWLDLDGLKFPVKVKINDRSYEKNGQVYWRNEIQQVITPDKPEYQQARKSGEIINENGAVSGSKSSNAGASQKWNYDHFGPEPNYDDNDTPKTMDDMIF